MINDYWRKGDAMHRSLMARAPIVCFYLVLAIVKVLKVLPGFHKVPKLKHHAATLLVIEAGKLGWNAIEFKELEQSAREYIGSESVTRLEIEKDRPRIKQILEKIRHERVTHFVYDPRTGHQIAVVALFTAFLVLLVLSRYRIVPIVYLTDFSLRVHRCQAAIVSALNGLVVTFVHPKMVHPIFPHRRILGPSLMPFSIKLLNGIRVQREENQNRKHHDPCIRFVGSLYEPRITFLHGFKKKLENGGQKIDIIGRMPSGKRISDEEYWERTISASIMITTADQATESVRSLDWSWVPQLVYRYLEVLAAGTLLLARPVPGIERYFRPDVHFISYETLDEAVNKTLYYIQNEEIAERIREEGYARATQLIKSSVFWSQIDCVLGSDAFF